MDWYWAFRTNSRCVRSLEESDQSSSTQSNSTARKMEQLNSTEINFIFEIILHKYSIGLMIVGKLVWQQEEDRKEDISIALIIREESFTSELFKDTLETISLIPALQDNVMIESGIFSITSTTLDVHSIFTLLSTLDWYLEVKIQAEDKQYSSCPLIQETNHKDPEYIDFSVPRRAKYVHSAWKKHQDAAFWVDINLAIKEGLTFFQTPIECNYTSRDTSSLLHSKSWKIQNSRSFVWKTILVSSTTTKDLIETRSQLDQRNDQLGSTVEQQPVGELIQQSFGEGQHVKFSKPTQPKPKPICDRSGKPEDTEDVFVDKGETSRSHEIDETGLHEELGSSDRSGIPEKLSENIRVKHAHDGTGQPVEQNSSSTHSERTICSWRKSWHGVIQRGQRVQPCNQRGEHWLQHFGSTTFCSETITWRQRSKFDSEDREPPSATWHFKVILTTSTIQPFQQRITRRD